MGTAYIMTSNLCRFVDHVTTLSQVQKWSHRSFAGALAGNPFGVDRESIAKDLGFHGGICPNSMDAVSDRDYVLETIFFATTLLIHLSRWAEDLIIYSSGQFKFVQSSDAYATGCSLGISGDSLTSLMHV